MHTSIEGLIDYNFHNKMAETGNFYLLVYFCLKSIIREPLDQGVGIFCTEIPVTYV